MTKKHKKELFDLIDQTEDIEALRKLCKTYIERAIWEAQFNIMNIIGVSNNE